MILVSLVRVLSRGYDVFYTNSTIKHLQIHETLLTCEYSTVTRSSYFAASSHQSIDTYMTGGWGEQVRPLLGVQNH